MPGQAGYLRGVPGQDKGGPARPGDTARRAARTVGGALTTARELLDVVPQDVPTIMAVG